MRAGGGDVRRYSFFQLDVFTRAPFGGNQLAVFPRADELTDAEMRAIAREMNYSETTFVVAARDPKAACRVRIFTPATELPFAGHPVVGTTFALARAGRLGESGSPVYLELGVGTLPVEVLYEERRPSFVWMTQPVPFFAPWQGDRARLAAALGVTEADFAPGLPIERGSAGVPFVYVPLRSRDAVGRAKPDPELAAALADPSSEAGPFAGHPAAYVFTLERAPGGADAHARMFGPGMGIVEDAATGAAGGPLGAYLVRHGAMQPDAAGETRIRVEQGVEMGRPSRIEVVIAGDARQIRAVRVGGEAVLVAEGEFYLP